MTLERNLSGTLWMGFRIKSNERQRYFYTNDNMTIKLENKSYFNKNTISVLIYKGYETEEHSENPISDEIIYISICYRITNYFGDKSGRHLRSKQYVIVNNRILQQCDFGEIKEITRIAKELKGILDEINIVI